MLFKKMHLHFRRILMLAVDIF